MKKLYKLLLLTVLIVLCVSLFCVYAAAETDQTKREMTAEELLLLEGFAPLMTELEEYYVIENVRVFNVCWKTTPLGEALYGTVGLDMTLRAETLNDLPFFQGISDYTGIADVNAASVSSVKASLQSKGAQFSADYAVSDALLATATVNVVNEMTAAYAEYIGKTSEFNYSLCITTDEAGNLEGAYADCEGIRRALTAYSLETEAEMKANGKTAFAENLSVELAQLEKGGVEVMALPPLYYRVNARDYANLYTSEASYNQTCPHGNHYIDLSKYCPYMDYFCHQDCANFVSQAIRAGQLPRDDTWKPYTLAWNCADDLYDYLYSNKGYVTASTFANCNAGNLIFNFRDGRPYHVNMCVHNDTVTRMFSAHNNDHKNAIYTDSYWGNAQYFVFYNSTSAYYSDPGTTRT